LFMPFSRARRASSSKAISLGILDPPSVPEIGSPPVPCAPDERPERQLALYMVEC